MAVRLSDTRMWQATLDRDGSYDGAFVLAVRTTGIFCRPTCASRKPRRENVEFFTNMQEALLAGYRPCRRCRPMERGDQPPHWVQGLLDAIEAEPGRRLTDGDVRRMSIDPARARRYFRSHYGMTFQAYQRSMRLGSALAHIRRGGDLTAVGYDHGFESSSGFREAFERLFGRTPGAARGARAADVMIVQWLDTPVGPFIAGATHGGVCLFEFADRRALQTQIEAISRRLACTAVPGTNQHLEQLAGEVGRYFEGNLTRFTVPLQLHGTPFQEAVWKALLEVPYGETRSYEQIAQAIGAPGACRAVGRANGQNRIAVIVPCHRVVGADGRLVGYGGGLWRKQYLLDLEVGGEGRGRGQLLLEVAAATGMSTAGRSGNQLSAVNRAG